MTFLGTVILTLNSNVKKYWHLARKKIFVILKTKYKECALYTLMSKECAMLPPFQSNEMQQKIFIIFLFKTFDPVDSSFTLKLPCPHESDS